MKKIDEIEKPISDWFHDYERTGNYGEELNDVASEVHEIEDEVYEDFEDNIDVYAKWKTQ